MKKVLGLSVSTLLLAALPAFGQDVSVVAPGTQPVVGHQGEWMGTDVDLWDNGAIDGLNGLSNATTAPFGFRRTLLFDFVVPSGQTWNVNELKWNHLWNTRAPGSGTGLEIRFYSDAGGSPGAPITSVVTSSSYSEVAGPGNYFSRQEAISTAGFTASSFTAGTYWTDATIVGPENNFWLTAPVKNSTQVWVDYADFGGLQPGSNIFGTNYDITGVLRGTTGGGGYTITITGSCPGSVRYAWTGAPANTQQAILHSGSTGSVVIPNGNPCAGTVLGLGGQPAVYNTIGTGNGSGGVNATVNAGACRRFVQGLAINGCVTSNVARVP